ncbi:MAG: hypothetical protein HZC41_21895 [Chloroflexi bacterium]|nr:hypothetical protein [Chloroflexota bacterium]
MYTAAVHIRGTTDLLQHAFGRTQLDTLQEATRKQTGTPDYSQEWLQTMYVTPDGYLYQPATHIEGALQKAASLFTVKGKGSKTWKDAVKAYVYVRPDQVLHLWHGEPVRAPGTDLLQQPTEHLSVNIMRVKVQRAAVARSRLQIGEGWELQFRLEVIDEQLPAPTLKAILEEAGRAIGIGDYRPRYGRFGVQQFEVG